MYVGELVRGEILYVWGYYVYGYYVERIGLSIIEPSCPVIRKTQKDNFRTFSQGWKVKRYIFTLFKTFIADLELKLLWHNLSRFLYALYLFTANDFVSVLYPAALFACFFCLSGTLLTINPHPTLFSSVLPVNLPDSICARGSDLAYM